MSNDKKVSAEPNICAIVYAPRTLFTEDEIEYAARTQFTWTHLRSIMSINDPLARKFYMQMCHYAVKLQKAIAIAREHFAEHKTNEMLE